MNNKRGLSTIIMTLIIILVSLVAVGIFWVVVQNLIKGSSENIGFGSLTLNAEIKGVQIDNSSNNVSLIVKRNTGEGDMTGIKFIFYSDDKNEIIEQDIQLEELEQKSFHFHLAMNVSLLTKISIYPIFLSGGKENVGNIADSYDVKTGTRIVIPPSGCTPTTNPCGSRICGNIANGTCGSISCGTCSVGTCNATGQCATSCVPTTCEALGHNCGSGYANGTCAGTLTCGSYGGGCQSGYTCVGGTCVEETGYTCGNNIVEPGEACDGTNLSGYTCATVAAGFASGSLSCNSNCRSYVTTSCVAGDIINAASCSQANVQSAINSASDGDIVQVPAGSCTWSSTVTINSKNIILRGAGIDKTNITDGTGTGWNENLINVNCVEGKPFRVTGFSFPCVVGDGTYKIYVAGTCKNWRVDHSKFEATGAPPKASAVIPDGYTYGVIDHCIFNDARNWMDGDGGNSWTRPLNLGTSEAVYIEDNYYYQTVFGNVVDSSDGASYVFRYNRVNGTADGGYIEAHSGCPNGQRATFKYEIYNNTLNLNDVWALAGLRGGTGVVFDNIFTGVSVGVPHISVDDERTCAPYNGCIGLWSGWNSTCNGTSPYDGNTPGMFGYACRDQIGRSTDSGILTPQSLEPLYEWDNKYNGNDVDIVINPVACALTSVHIQENRDYYNDMERPNYVPYAYPHPIALIN
ncbi:MAG: hypothetical protein PHQ66_01930 [Candidatus Nanoarchaeia archaeon]|nr:hypothetical protein [Candidatus Nanoarchaeia archaeon]MDD5357869.1 hypothetical protein [Candidatus Nanoarchaeia archaeon]MDD5588788.1 hypothetical protein [Candidatus Nanoarchaeia archaeon]